MSAERLRAVVLSALMILSVIGGSIAFAGAAGAGNTSGDAVSVAFDRGGGSLAGDPSVATATEPVIQFNQSITLRPSENDALILENTDTGANVTITPDEVANLTDANLELYDGTGQPRTNPTIDTFGADTPYNVSVTGNASATYVAPISNLTVTYVDNGTAVARTPADRAHAFNYTGDVSQNSTTGTIEFAVPRQKLLPGSSAQLVSFDSQFSKQMTYVSSRDAYVTRINASRINGTESGGVIFETQADGSYFFEPTQLETGSTNSTGANATVNLTDLRGHGESLSRVGIESVTLPEGGFVVIRDGNYTNQPFGSTRGVSTHLPSGTHENIEVELDEPISENQTVAAFIHRDTDGDRTYDFNASNGSQDGAYTDDSGNLIIDTEPLELLDPFRLTLSNQTADGTTVTVDSATLPEGAYLTVFDERILNGTVFDAVRGHSSYLGAGTYQNVTIQLDKPLNESQTVVLIAQRDTDGDQTYDFTATNGSDDGPHVNINGIIPADGAEYTVDNASQTTVSVDPVDPRADVGGNTTVAVVLDDASDGVRSYDFNLTVSNGSVATIKSVEFRGNPGFTDSNIDRNGTRINVVAATANTSKDTGAVTMAVITLQGTSEGTADVGVTVPDGGIGDENNDAYIVTGINGGQLTVEAGPPPVGNRKAAPADPDGDGRYEDVNGDGQFSIVDVSTLFDNRGSSAVQNNQAAFDFNEDGQFSVVDISALFDQV